MKRSWFDVHVIYVDKELLKYNLVNTHEKILHVYNYTKQSIQLLLPHLSKIKIKGTVDEISSDFQFKR